jgi:hypothetical protein
MLSWCWPNQHLLCEHMQLFFISSSLLRYWLGAHCAPNRSSLSVKIDRCCGRQVYFIQSFEFVTTAFKPIYGVLFPCQMPEIKYPSILSNDPDYFDGSVPQFFLSSAHSHSNMNMGHILIVFTLFFCIRPIFGPCFLIWPACRQPLSGLQNRISHERICFEWTFYGWFFMKLEHISPIKYMNKTNNWMIIGKKIEHGKQIFQQLSNLNSQKNNWVI